MNKKRDRLQIIHDILSVIREKNGKIKPTHILYKSNLSYQMMEEYLQELIQKGFVVEHLSKQGKTYSVTERAHNYLEHYGMIKSFVENFGLD